jgi:hypothetical protein
VSAGFDVDPSALGDTADALIRAAERIDRTGASSPGSGGAGDAGALLADVLAVTANTGARLGVEARTLGVTVAECVDAYDTTDSAQAEAYLITGEAQ